ncbi:MAG: hypothetical protein WDN48_00105 [Pseudolabrys sp.]
MTVGIARANVVDGVIDNEGSLFAVALLLGPGVHRGRAALPCCRLAVATATKPFSGAKIA